MYNYAQFDPYELDWTHFLKNPLKRTSLQIIKQEAVINQQLIHIWLDEIKSLKIRVMFVYLTLKVIQEIISISYFVLHYSSPWNENVGQTRDSPVKHFLFVAENLHIPISQ